MQRKYKNLEYFICTFSFHQKHYLVKPILLACGHVACHQCVEDLKNNTSLKKINCLKCNNDISLEIDYDESTPLKNYMSDYSDKIMESLTQDFEETLSKAKSKINIFILKYVMYQC